LGKYAQIARYVVHYKAWREQWGKPALIALGYGGIPDGEAWNPPTWILYAQLRNAAVELRALPQYQYLQVHFADRPKSLFSRLYYALCADEVKCVRSAMDDFNANQHLVRGVIYDSILSEGSSEELLAKHGLVTKPFTRWRDNLFMCLRKDAERTDHLLFKVPGKRMCIPSSCYNVGTSKIQKALRTVHRHGPHTSKYIQQIGLEENGPVLEGVGFVSSGQSQPKHRFLLLCSRTLCGHLEGV
jgi:hypothetical protein